MNGPFVMYSIFAYLAVCFVGILFYGLIKKGEKYEC